MKKLTRNCLMIAAVALFTALSCKHTSEPPLVLGQDTTSHAFQWTISRFGDSGGSPSELYGVAIVNDTLAYAVGEIYLKDSSGQVEITPHNVLRWNGKVWEPLRIPYHYLGQSYYRALHAICAFSDSDIWFCGTQAIRLTRSGFEEVLLPSSAWGPTLIKKAWGTSSKDLYIAGGGGSIAHFDGQTWRKMESGTLLEINGLSGSPDGKTVWAVATDRSYPGTYLLGLDTKTGFWNKVYDGTSMEFRVSMDSLSGGFEGLFAPNQHSLYLATSAGVYLIDNQGLNLPRATRFSFTADWFPGYPRALAGSSAADLFIVGQHGMIAHYNGSSWNQYGGSGQLYSEFAAVHRKGNLVIAVGFELDPPVTVRGLIMLGRR